MKKSVYHISGFDCPNCAAKVERHLNKKEFISNATIDFANERLFITYRDDPLSLDELVNVIKEVEDDPLRIEQINNSKKISHSILTPKFFKQVGRIILSAILLLIGALCFDEGTTPSIVFSTLALLCVVYDIVWSVILNCVKHRNPIDEHLLLTLSSVGVFVLFFLVKYKILDVDTDIDLFDGVMVVILYQIGKIFEDIATGKSKDAISNAIDLRADIANLITDNKIVQVKPETLNVGDKILIRIGDIIPADGVIIDGSGTLDMSSLNGEPMPVDALIGKNVLSGSILKSGSITVEVNKVFKDSTISKILEIVQSSGEHKSQAEKFITKFARVYTPSVLAIGVSFALIYGIITGGWSHAIYHGLQVLVVGCPCAIVISVPLAYFAGIGLASKRGIIIKGSNYLDSLCNVGVIFLDKTGTLTYGNFEVTEEVNINISKEDFKTYLLAAESRSNHPIAKAIVLHQNISAIALEQTEYEEIAGLGTKTKFNAHTIVAGNINLLRKEGIDIEEVETSGTVIYLGVDSKFVGYVVLKDIVRDRAKLLIKKLDELNIKTVLLSGDKEKTVKEVAQAVGIKEWHSSLLPQDKTKYVEDAIASNKTGKVIAFAGDGINDTPSIIRSDVGFAMGGIGSDVAVENSDVVIMQDHPLKIYDSIVIAKKTRFVSLFNIIFSLIVKITVMVLCMTGIVNNMAIAVLADTGLTVLMTLNSLLIIYTKID